MFFFLLRPPNLLAAAVSEKFNNETDGLAAVQMLMDLINNDYSIVHVSGVPKSHQRDRSILTPQLTPASVVSRSSLTRWPRWECLMAALCLR